MTITVQLNPSIVGRTLSNAQTLSINYATSGGSPGVDYTPTNGTFSWAAGNTADQTFQVGIVNHTGSPRSFNVVLSIPAGGGGGIQLGSYPTAVVPITDPSAPPVSPPPPPPALPTVQFSSSIYSTSDQASIVYLGVTESQGASATVYYSTHDLTAVAGKDYAGATSYSAAISSGSGTIWIPLIDDHLVEPDETFSVTLDSVSYGVLGLPTRAVVTIHDADTMAPHVTFSSASVLENVSTGTAQVTATLSRPYSIPFTAPYQTSNGGAVAPGDYTATAGTLTFAANQTSQPVSIPIINDNDPYEAPKSFTVSPQGGVNTNFLYNLYGDLLYRDADAQGLKSWNTSLSSGTTRTQVARIFESTAEYVPELIDGVYQRYLLRRADGSGISYWASQLINVPGFTPEDLIGNVLGSYEYFGTRASLDNGTFVKMIYYDLLGRPASSSEVNNWLNQLGSHSRAYVATAVAKSLEYYNAYVSAMYVRYLRRTATSAEVSSWATPLNNQTMRSEDFVANLIGSLEYWNHLLTIASVSTGTVTIDDPPDPGPQITSPGNQYNFVMDAVSLPIKGSDNDTDTLSYTAISGLPAGLGISSTGVISGTISANAVGVYTTVISVSDGYSSASTSFTWTVSDTSAQQPAGFPDLALPDTCGCQRDLVGTATGAPSSNDGPTSGYSAETPVRFYDGVVQMDSSSDVSSNGFGMEWGLDRSWTNGVGYATNAFNGSGMVDSEMPYMIQDGTGNHFAVITNGTNARFYDLNNGLYNPRYYLQEGLSYDAANHQYVLQDTTGQTLRFWDFTVTPTGKRGQFQSLIDPYGNLTSVVSWTSDGKPIEVQRSVVSGGQTVIESFLNGYVASGVDAGLLGSVTLRRQVGGGAWTTVRQAVYGYGDGTQSYANVGDLMLVTVNDGQGHALDTSYFRYYTTLDAPSGGYVHGLKYYFSPESYARMAAALGNPLTAADSAVLQYADDFLQYDSAKRVSKIVIQGQGEYDYAYAAPSSNANGYDSWKYKTTETRPADGTQHIVYTNYVGEIMLDVFVQGSNQWKTFYEYDYQGRLIRTAEPSAVTGFTESSPDLLQLNSNGTYQYLNFTGLIEDIDYWYFSPAGQVTSGAEAGYVRDTAIQQGQSGSPIYQTYTEYSPRSVGNFTIYVPASDTLYRTSANTGWETTDYTYTWYPNTLQPQSIQVTLPVIGAAQNGPGVADTETSVFDVYGNEVWHRDGDNYLSYTSYDPVTGAVLKTIDDVNTAYTGNFQNLPSGWSSPTANPLNLITLYTVDALGRTTEIVDPNSNITYLVYNDPNYEVLTYPGWNSAANPPGPTGPTEVTREDRANSYVETFTMSAAPHLTNGVPDGTEPIGNLQTLSRTYVNNLGQVVETDDYFNLSGLTYSTAPHIGAAGTNFYATLYGYDLRGRQNHEVSATGTITDTTYDGLGRVVGTSVGTVDSGPNNNMVQVSAEVYDNGGIGDSNLTQETTYPGGSAAPRVSQYFYDWRDRLVASKDGVQASEDNLTHRPILYNVYDNLDEVITQQQYDGDGVTISSTNGVPQPPSANLLRAQSSAAYDNQGRVYQTQTFLVDQSSGAVSSSALTTNIWYDHRGDVIETAEPGGLVYKSQFDGAGRETVSYVTDGGGGSTWMNAGNVTGDTVLMQTETQYDSNGNPILVTTRQRNHDDGGWQGPLANATTNPRARVSYAAAYYDQLDRPIATVDVGTNGGAAYTRPGSPPPPSDTALVSTMTYNAAGWESSVTDPRGIVNVTNYDNLGRVVQTVAAYTNGVPTTNTNSTTNYTYDGDNNLLTYTAVEPGGQQQTTQYFYNQVYNPGPGSDISSKDILSAVYHPDPATGQPSAAYADSYTVNALGETKTATDANGTQHTYSHDILGRLVSDAVTGFAAGVDSTVKRIEIAYDTAGRPYLYTSFDAAAGGNILNQVQQSYNGLGQLTTEYQSHAGPVNTSTTPSVQYGYTQMAGGQNNSRLVSMTYPNGRVLNYNYNNGLDSNISRLSSISSPGPLEGYQYLGLDTVVERDNLQINVNLTYISQNGSTGDAGDQYTGLDRFGRVVDQNWYNTSTHTSTDRFQYGYDRNGNVLYKNNLVDSLFSELYHASGAGNGYDPLNQLAGFVRGTLSASTQGGPLDTVTNPSTTESWNLDALGNWSSVTKNNVTQNRTANQQNEVTAAGTQTLSYDANGNTLVDDQGQHYTYDAWNRLVKVTASGGAALATYSYDALGRRIVENEGGVARDLYYSAAWQVLEERVSGATKVQYVWSPVYVDALVERDRDPNNSGTLSERLYVQQDANWNVTALVDASGNVKERYVYDPYGQVTVLSPTWATLSGSAYAWNYLHQGGRFDLVTGLYNFRNRDYSPTLGRWMQNDPAGFAAVDSNLYRYLTNHPSGWTDPFGLAPPPIDLGEGFTGRIDVMPRKGGKLGGHMHIYDKSGREVAKINERGGYQVAHKGAKLLKPSELPAPVRNRAGRLLKKWAKRAGIIGLGLAVFFVCDEVRAEGVKATAIKNTPVLGDYIQIQGLIEEETDKAYEDLNSANRRSHERAREMLVKWLSYELEHRKVTQIDEEALKAALAKFYTGLQSKYYLEEATGKAANINDIAKQFQEELETAVNAPISEGMSGK